MIPRFTEFYIPVLKVLKIYGGQEINELTEIVANSIGLSREDRKIMTKSGRRERYRSNIHWAITDLTQGDFIRRPSRGFYNIAEKGIEMLKDNPPHPDREYLAAHSEQFRLFLERKGTRSNKHVEKNEFSIDINHENELLTENEEPLEITLKELYASMRTLRKAKISTVEIEAKASELEERLIREKVLPLLSQQLTPALHDIERGLVLVVDYIPGQEVKVSLSRRRDYNKSIDAKEITSNNVISDSKKSKTSETEKTSYISSNDFIYPNSKGKTNEGHDPFHEFKMYLTTLNSNRGKPYQKSSINLYTNSLRGSYLTAIIHKHTGQRNLENVTNLALINKIILEVESDLEKGKSNPTNLLGLKLYRDFLIERNSKQNESTSINENSLAIKKIIADNIIIDSGDYKDMFVQFLNEIGPELVHEMNLMIMGNSLIDTSRNPLFISLELKGGYWVNILAHPQSIIDYIKKICINLGIVFSILIEHKGREISISK